MIVRVTAPGVVGAYRDLATQPVAVLAVDVAVHVVVHGLPPAASLSASESHRGRRKNGWLDFLKSSSNLKSNLAQTILKSSKKVAWLCSVLCPMVVGEWSLTSDGEE